MVGKFDVGPETEAVADTYVGIEVGCGSVAAPWRWWMQPVQRLGRKAPIGVWRGWSRTRRRPYLLGPRPVLAAVLPARWHCPCRAPVNAAR